MVIDDVQPGVIQGPIGQFVEDLMAGHAPAGVGFSFVSEGSFAHLRSLEDRELIALVGRSDRAAFRELYERHAGSLHSALRRLCPGSDCEDLLQEVFLAVWRRSSLYDPGGVSRRPGCSRSCATR